MEAACASISCFSKPNPRFLLDPSVCYGNVKIVFLEGSPVRIEGVGGMEVEWGGGSGQGAACPG